MANGYYERGEVYWLRLDGGVGSEMGIGRPAVIVSSPENNNRSECVVVAYTTKQYHNTPYHITTYATGIRTYVVCSQLYTYDKSRLQKLAGVLSKEELRLVDDALEKLFDLGYTDDSKDEEIEAKDAEIADLKAQIEAQKLKYDDELLSYKVENSMWQKCYDKVLTQLVDMKCMNDLFMRGHKTEEPKVPVVVEVPKVPEQPKVIDPEEPVLPVVNIPDEPVEVKDDRVDINHCTQTQLKKVGMSDALARAVVAKRPFNSVADLKNVQGMTKKRFQIWEPKLTCTPLEIIEIPAEPVVPEVTEVAEVVTEAEVEGKLNINAVSGKDLMEALGMSSPTAYAITGYRRKNGPYAKLEDIANAPKITMNIVERYRDKIYCGPGIEEQPIQRKSKIEEPTEPYTGEKININTASAEEIHTKTGLSKTVCFSITGCRKRDGNYRSVEDLANVPRFTEAHMKKYGPMFEV